MEKIKKYLPIVSVLILSLPVISPLANEGLYLMHDNTQVARVYEMAVALRDGMFPVRWVPDLGYGYGYPIFNFYGPLPYYIGAFLYFIFGNATVATKYTIGLGTLLAGVTMYILTRKHFGKNASIAASITYMFFPYHALNVYVRGAIGETYAYAFLPLVLYGIWEIFDRGQNLKKSIFPIILTGVAFASVIISHNLSAFMLALMLLPILTSAIVLSKRKKIFFLSIISAFTLGGMLAAFYALPAILEMGYTNVTSQVGGGADFRDHFVCYRQLWSGMWGFGGSAPGCVDGMSFALGKNNIAIIAFSVPFVVWYFAKVKKQENIFQILTACILLVCSLFLMLPVSRFVWEVTPAIEFLQFPWRFLNFTAIGISILAAWVVWGLGALKYEKSAVVAAIIITVSQILMHQDIFAAQQYNTTPDKEYLIPANLNFKVSKISDEYLPKNFQKPTDENDIPYQKIEVVRGEGSVREIGNKTNRIVATIDTEQPATVRINSAPFPAWTLYTNGEKKQIEKKNDGVYFDVGQGSQRIEYVYESTMIEKIANIVSLVGFGLIILGIIALRKK